MGQISQASQVGECWSIQYPMAAVWRLNVMLNWVCTYYPDTRRRAAEDRYLSELLLQKQRSRSLPVIGTTRQHLEESMLLPLGSQWRSPCSW